MGLLSLGKFIYRSYKTVSSQIHAANDWYWSLPVYQQVLIPVVTVVVVGGVVFLVVNGKGGGSTGGSGSSTGSSGGNGGGGVSSPSSPSSSFSSSPSSGGSSDSFDSLSGGLEPSSLQDALPHLSSEALERVDYLLSYASRLSPERLEVLRSFSLASILPAAYQSGILNPYLRRSQVTPLFTQEQLTGSENAPGDLYVGSLFFAMVGLPSLNLSESVLYRYFNSLGCRTLGSFLIEYDPTRGSFRAAEGRLPDFVNPDLAPTSRNLEFYSSFRDISNLSLLLAAINQSWSWLFGPILGERATFLWSHYFHEFTLIFASISEALNVVSDAGFFG